MHAITNRAPSFNRVLFAKTTLPAGCRGISNLEPQKGSKDLGFCQPGHLSLKELKVLKEHKKELEIFNQKILNARKLADHPSAQSKE